MGRQRKPEVQALRATFGALAKPDQVIRGGTEEFTLAVDRLRDELERHRRRVAGEPVRSEPTADGLRLVLADGFLMLRASSTESVLRIYAEASGPRRVRRRLSAGRELLGAE